MPDAIPTANPGAAGPNPISSILAVLAGAGFEKFAGGLQKLAQSGMDLQTIFSLPNFPLMLAGAGGKDAANSMEIFGPMLKMFMPQPQQPQGPNPNELSTAMRMLSARLGNNMEGIKLPPQALGSVTPQMGQPPSLPIGGMV